MNILYNISIIKILDSLNKVEIAQSIYMILMWDKYFGQIFLRY